MSEHMYDLPSRGTSRDDDQMERRISQEITRVLLDFEERGISVLMGSVGLSSFGVVRLTIGDIARIAAKVVREEPT